MNVEIGVCKDCVRQGDRNLPPAHPPPAGDRRASRGDPGWRSTSLPQGYFFLNSFFLSLFTFALGFCPFSNCPPLALVGLTRSLSYRHLLCRYIIKVRISTFTGNASKAATVSFSYKSSYSTPSLPFKRRVFPSRLIKIVAFRNPSPSLPSNRLTFQSFVLFLNVPQFLTVGLPTFVAAALQPASACMYRLSVMVMVMAIATIGAPAKWIRPNASTRVQQDQSNKYLTGTRDLPLLRRRRKNESTSLGVR